MRLLYKDAVPFEIKTLKQSKQILLSNDINDDFNYFYTYIEKLIDNKLDIEKVIKDLSKKYEAISYKIVDEIRQSGDKKSTHIQEEIEFIFACSYRLLDAYAIKQFEIGKIFDLRPNEFKKLGLYPMRSHDAYCKLDNDYLAMQPHSFGKPQAIEMADFLNKDIQAKYLSSATILVTNELNLIANVATTDNKDYFLTRPADSLNATYTFRSHYSYARMAFALAYFMQDDNGNKVPLGKIVDKIKQILEAKEECVLVDALRHMKILSSDKSLGRYVRDIGVGTYEDSVVLLEKKLKEYRYHYETVERADFYLSQDSHITGIIFEDEHFGAYSDDMNLIQSWNKKQDEKNNGVLQFETEEEVIEYHLKHSTDIVNGMEDELLSMIDGKKYFDDNKEDYYSYLKFIKGFILEGFKFNDIVTEDKLRIASCFYLAEVFKEVDVNDERILEVRNYLDTGQISVFIDAVDKDSSKVHTQVIEDAENLINELDAISGFVDSEGKRKGNMNHLNLRSEKGNETTLLYIDLEAYNLSQEELNIILERYRVILVIHGYNQFLGVSLLNEELQLYSNVKECSNAE